MPSANTRPRGIPPWPNPCRPNTVAHRFPAKTPESASPPGEVKSRAALRSSDTEHSCSPTGRGGRQRPTYGMGADRSEAPPNQRRAYDGDMTLESPVADACPSRNAACRAGVRRDGAAGSGRGRLRGHAGTADCHAVRDGGGGDGGRAGGATESDGRRSRAGGDCASRDAGTDGSRTRPDRLPASSRSASCDGQCDAEPYARAATRAPGRRSDGPIERGRQPDRARDGIAGSAAGRSGSARAAGSGGVGVPGALWTGHRGRGAAELRRWTTAAAGLRPGAAGRADRRGGRGRRWPERADRRVALDRRAAGLVRSGRRGIHSPCVSRGRQLRRRAA